MISKSSRSYDLKSQKGVKRTMIDNTASYLIRKDSTKLFIFSVILTTFSMFRSQLSLDDWVLWPIITLLYLLMLNSFMNIITGFHHLKSELSNDKRQRRIPGNMKLLRNGKESKKIYNYHCDGCKADFYLDCVVNPTGVHCPHCGESCDVAINSEHLNELNGQ